MKPGRQVCCEVYLNLGVSLAAIGSFEASPSNKPAFPMISSPHPMNSYESNRTDLDKGLCLQRGDNDC